MAPTRGVSTASALQPIGEALRSSLLPFDAWLHLRDALRLSDRELQIVQGIFNDQELVSIGATLSLSEEMVYRTVQRIYVKLRIGSKAELVVRVMAEYLALAADQGEGDVSGLIWPVKSERLIP